MSSSVQKEGVIWANTICSGFWLFYGTKLPIWHIYPVGSAIIIIDIPKLDSPPFLQSSSFEKALSRVIVFPWPCNNLIWPVTQIVFFSRTLQMFSSPKTSNSFNRNFGRRNYEPVIFL